MKWEEPEREEIKVGIFLIQLSTFRDRTFAYVRVDTDESGYRMTKFIHEHSFPTRDIALEAAMKWINLQLLKAQEGLEAIILQGYGFEKA